MHSHRIRPFVLAKLRSCFELSFCNLRTGMVFLLLGLSGLANAEEPGILPSDVPLTLEELQRLFSAGSFGHNAEGNAQVSDDPSALYLLPEQQGVGLGGVELMPDGRVCLKNRNGKPRCDLYVRNNGVTFRIGESGFRLPIRTEFTVRP